jgi:hypothetical protein
MRAAQLWLFGALVSASAVGLGVAACGDSEGTTSTTEGNGGDSTSTQNTGGSGGMGSTSTMNTTSTMSTSTGPLTCTSEYTNIPAEGSECDLLQQNCGPNQTCDVVGDAEGNITLGCLPANGVKGVGQDCAQGECQPGLMCIGQCTPVCCKDTNEPCGAGVCNVTVTLSDPEGNPTEFTYVVCAYDPACTIFDPTSCPDGQDCHLSAEPGLATCSPPSNMPVDEGEPCMYVNDCADSQICITVAEPDYFCRWLCTTGSPEEPGLGGCPDGQSCQPYPDAGFPNMGICLPPA